MKWLSHWTTAFITLVVLTYIGLQDPGFKEILRLKSFDFVLSGETKTPSKDITIITIDEEAIQKYGQWPFPRQVLADLIVDLRPKSEIERMPENQNEEILNLTVPVIQLNAFEASAVAKIHTVLKGVKL